MKRIQGVFAVVITVAVIAAGSLAQRIGVKPASMAGEGRALSGAWFCPHGGGADWSGALELANPGDRVASVRITSFGPDGATQPKILSVEPGTTQRVDVPVSDRGASSMVEYFGVWIAAGWVTQAGGEESGIAAEPCIAEAGRLFYLPDGTTEKGQDSYVIVMNPFAAEAVFSLRLLTKDRPISTGELSNFVLRPRHSVAFHINQVQLLDTVSVEVTATLGRVAAASLGIASSGGIRSAVGVPDAATRWVLPGGLDTNTASVPTMNPSGQRALIEASLYTDDSEQTAAGAQNQGMDPDRARTFSVITSSPSTIDLRSAAGVVAVRRTSGVGGDQGATGGASTPGPAWTVLPAVGSPPYDARLLISNPGALDAKVTLTLLGNGSQDSSVNVLVPSHRTVLAPTGYINASPLSAVRLEASQGVVVPVFTAYSADHAGYATSVGIPDP